MALMQHGLMQGWQTGANRAPCSAATNNHNLHGLVQQLLAVECLERRIAATVGEEKCLTRCWHPPHNGVRRAHQHTFRKDLARDLLFELTHQGHQSR